MTDSPTTSWRPWRHHRPAPRGAFCASCAEPIADGATCLPAPVPYAPQAVACGPPCAEPGGSTPDAWTDARIDSLDVVCARFGMHVETHRVLQGGTASFYREPPVQFNGWGDPVGWEAPRYLKHVRTWPEACAWAEQRITRGARISRAVLAWRPTGEPTGTVAP